ncbi:glycosyltransferase family protein [Cerasicoccus maritimus]|uniref:glycosyltransferase family protein n=1 Tax=Cerasicoccus maritimus TaxID=490089 RepID=UPI00285289E4|nr:glycosyltransferase family protein [Cerasicoccus maritimus]
MASKKLKFMFIVQGEGRGHFTQAMALRRLLASHGHEVTQVLVGKNDRRDIPQFFKDGIHAPVRMFRSPTFVVDANRRGILIGPTIFKNLLRLPLYIKSFFVIRRRIRRHKPDVVVNFYELLAGLSFMAFRPRKTKIMCVGHQYLLHHPEFEFPPGKVMDRTMLLFNNWMTAFGSDKLLALSFREMDDLPDRKIFVMPPLLRDEVIQLDPKPGDFILLYILNDGYAEEVANWQKQNPHVVIHGFWDRSGAEEMEEYQPNLFFHKLSGVKFLERMATCKAFVSTAGFESICEAMYLDKPVLLRPTGGHFEQQCNAIDAVKAGAGMAAEAFHLDEFMEFIQQDRAPNAAFRNWARRADQRFLEMLTGEPAVEQPGGETADALRPASQ